MTIVSMTTRNEWPEHGGYTYKETIASGTVGNTVPIPPSLKKTNITCTLIAGSNYGKFQFTTSPDDSIIAGTAVWINWPKGSVTGTNYDVVMSPITGLRGVSVSGQVTIEIVR